MFAINTTNAQVFSEGDKIIDVYYGFPNLYKIAFKTSYANSGQELNLNVGGVGPLGIRGEYMVADKVGVGVDIGFSNTKITYQENDNFGEGSESQIYEYNYNTKKLGVMVTFNYHFVENSDNFDAYFTLGAGYGNRTFGSSSTDPDFGTVTFNSPFPVAARVGVGMRYFFNENIGVNLGIGLGQGGLLNGGLSFKL